MATQPSRTDTVGKEEKDKQLAIQRLEDQLKYISSVRGHLYAKGNTYPTWRDEIKYYDGLIYGLNFSLAVLGKPNRRAAANPYATGW